MEQIIRKIDEFIERQGIVSSELCMLMDQLEKEIERNQEVIKFYADEKNYNWDQGPAPVIKDAGKLARSLHG